MPQLLSIVLLFLVLTARSAWSQPLDRGGMLPPPDVRPQVTSFVPREQPQSAVQSEGPEEELITFDPLRLQITWSRGGWQLMDGPTLLKDFGRRQDEARQALRVIRDLRLTQMGRIGSPIPIMEYWLVDHQAPRGKVHDARVFPVDLASLRAEQAQGQWCVRDGSRILFNFGLRKEQAQEAVAIIQKYQLTRIAMIGQATPSMMVFLHDPNDIRRADQGSLRARADALSQQKAQSYLQNAGKKLPRDTRAAFTASSLYMTPALPPLRHPDQTSRLASRVRHTSFSSTTMRPVPGISDLTTRIPFDWRQVYLRQAESHWELRVGSSLLHDFGPDERLARQALQLIYYYRFTERCLVGLNPTRFSYFLVNGQEPRGVVFGTQYVAFEPKNIQVKKVNSSWCIVTGDKPLLSLGDRQDEAFQLLQTMQRLQVDRICWLGKSPEEGFSFFARSR